MEEIMNAWIIPGLPRSYKLISMEEIIGIVGDYQKIPATTLMGGNRKFRIVYARHLCFYILWLTKRFTLKEIGGYFSKDHKTIIYGRDVFINQISLKWNNRYKEDSEHIIAKIGMTGKTRDKRLLNPHKHKSKH